MTEQTTERTAPRKRMLSGIKPSGDLTLGSYLGAIRNWRDRAEEFDCYYFMADLHAITVRQNPADLRRRTMEQLAQYIACGLDPEKNVLFIQSHVHQHAELGWVLNCYSMFGELSRMTQFKDKSAKNADNINGGLFTYPALMAADILAYQADMVPVGRDQKQHLELTRRFARRFNQLYGVDYFPECQPYRFGGELVKLPGLDGSGKMGKSEGTGIYLADTDEAIRKKVMKAVTDSGPTAPDSPMPEVIANLFTLLKVVSSPDTVQFFTDKWNRCEIRYGDLKKQLAEDIIRVVAPIRERIRDIAADEAYLARVVKQGAEKARASASGTVANVRRSMGIKPV